MTKYSLNKLVFLHIKISLLIIFIGSFLTSFYLGWHNFDLLGFLSFFLVSLLFALPIILGLYLSYALILMKVRLGKILSPIFVILGAWILPQLGYWATFGIDEPNWGLLFFKFMVINNILLLVANEILLFISLKKLK